MRKKKRVCFYYLLFCQKNLFLKKSKVLAAATTSDCRIQKLKSRDLKRSIQKLKCSHITMQPSLCIHLLKWHNLPFTPEKKPQHLGWVTPLKDSNSVNPLQLYCYAESWCEVFERSQYFSSNLRRLSEVPRRWCVLLKHNFQNYPFKQEERRGCNRMKMALGLCVRR